MSNHNTRYEKKRHSLPRRLKRTAKALYGEQPRTELDRAGDRRFRRLAGSTRSSISSDSGASALGYVRASNLSSGRDRADAPRPVEIRYTALRYERLNLPRREANNVDSDSPARRGAPAVYSVGGRMPSTAPRERARAGLVGWRRAARADRLSVDGASRGRTRLGRGPPVEKIGREPCLDFRALVHDWSTKMLESIEWKMLQYCTATRTGTCISK